MRTLLVGDGEGVCFGVGESGTAGSGEIDGEGGSPTIGEGVGVGAFCAAAIATQETQESKMRVLKRRSAICDLSIIAPVHVRKNVVSPFTVAQKFFIGVICDKLIV